VSGGRAPKQKGDRAERLAVDLMREAGFAAERSLRPGATPGRKAPTYDISAPLLGVDRRIECKARTDGFARLYAWLSENYALVVKADRKEPLVVLRLKDALEVAKVAKIKKAINRNSSRKSAKCPS
jgi:Holliday junction resolvase